MAHTVSNNSATITKTMQRCMMFLVVTNIVLMMFAFHGPNNILDSLTTESSSGSVIKSPMIPQHQYQHKEPGRQYQNNTTREKENSDNVIINYFVKPNAFVSTMIECFLQPKCHIHYIHIAKSGGTTIERKFELLLPHKFGSRLVPRALGYGKFNSCCGRSALSHFVPSRDCFQPVTSMQVSGNEFHDEIIQPCLIEYSKKKNYEEMQEDEDHNANNPHHRHHNMVALVSFRDPISTILSSIHQLCNKNLHRRTEVDLRMCNNCDYEMDKAEWNGLAKRKNREYESLYNDVVVGVSEKGIPVLTISTEDISPFFQRFENQLLTNYRDNLPKEILSKLVKKARKGEGVVANPEKKDLCDFSLKSGLIKALGPSLAVHRNLTIGW